MSRYWNWTNLVLTCLLLLGFKMPWPRPGAQKQFQMLRLGEWQIGNVKHASVHWFSVHWPIHSPVHKSSQESSFYNNPQLTQEVKIATAKVRCYNAKHRELRDVCVLPGEVCIARAVVHENRRTTHNWAWTWATGTSHRKVFWTEPSTRRDGTLKNQPN